MNKKNDKKKIKNLDAEIQLVQMEDFINNFDNAMKKDLRSRLKKVVLFIGPLILSYIGFLIFKNPTILIIGSSITGVGTIATLTKDFIIEAKSLISNHYKSNSNIFEIEQKKDVDKILQEGIGKAKGKDFYSEKYESFIKKEETYVETEKEKNIEKL